MTKNKLYDPLELPYAIASAIEEGRSIDLDETIEQAIVNGCCQISDKIVKSLTERNFDEFLLDTIKEGIHDLIWEGLRGCKIEINIKKETNNE